VFSERFGGSSAWLLMSSRFRRCRKIYLAVKRRLRWEEGEAKFEGRMIALTRDDFVNSTNTRIPPIIDIADQSFEVLNFIKPLD
jgi:hypothetical protein